MSRPQFIYDSANGAVEFDHLAMTYLLIEIDMLNDSLAKSLPATRDRRAVVTEFFNRKTDLLDGYSFSDSEVSADQWAPMLCFGRIENADEMAKNPVYVQPRICPLEEYIGGLIEQYFGEFEEKLPQTIALPR